MWGMLVFCLFKPIKSQLKQQQLAQLIQRQQLPMHETANAAGFLSLTLNLSSFPKNILLQLLLY